jgi:putative Mg2+ transporter-C (MgtC) family protein
MLHDLNIYIVGRLLLAALLGGAVGLERELSRKPAGLRTNMLICVGAALFTIISYEMAANVGGDHTRIAAQIIPGIGFIGAGVVIRQEGAIIGITSAATIFVMASIGMAVGAGLPATAIFTTMFLLVALVGLGKLEGYLGVHDRLMQFRVTAAAGGDFLDRVHKVVEGMGLQTDHWQAYQSDHGPVVEFVAPVTIPQERDLLTRLGALGARCEANIYATVKVL